jgi:hypothetical protein
MHVTFTRNSRNAIMGLNPISYECKYCYDRNLAQQALEACFGGM